MIDSCEYNINVRAKLSNMFSMSHEINNLKMRYDFLKEKNSESNNRLQHFQIHTRDYAAQCVLVMCLQALRLLHFSNDDSFRCTFLILLLLTTQALL